MSEVPLYPTPRRQASPPAPFSPVGPAPPPTSQAERPRWQSLVGSHRLSGRSLRLRLLRSLRLRLPGSLRLRRPLRAYPGKCTLGDFPNPFEEVANPLEKTARLRLGTPLRLFGAPLATAQGARGGSPPPPTLFGTLRLGGFFRPARLLLARGGTLSLRDPLRRSCCLVRD